MGLRRDLELIIQGKPSKLGEFHGAIYENLDVWYVRDDELAPIAALLTGNPFAGMFYNIETETYLLWDEDLDSFKESEYKLYEAEYYSEDFEGGALPATWSVVQGGENDWHVGTATAQGGTYSLYISNDGGTSNVYSSVGGGLDVSHAYFDILLPSASNNITLSFDWKCEAEIGFDYSEVFNCPTSFTPTANVEVVDGVDGDKIGKTEFNDNSTWDTETITLPLAQGGTTRRIVFSWRNDTTVQNQPPMAIDNVKITYS